MRATLAIIVAALAGMVFTVAAFASHTVTQTYTKTAGKNTFTCTITYVDENDNGRLDRDDTVLEVTCTKS